MAERPILFSAPMVRAILDGTKTQTRRIVKGAALDWLARDGFTPEFTSAPENHLCPYGQPGDQLWVREAWAPHPQDATTTFYKATTEAEPGFPVWSGPWRPSIHMPRRASRITLEITRVRVERLQDISDADCIAEGIGLNSSAAGVKLTLPPGALACKAGYQALWETLNGPDSWGANPWVWVVEFRRFPPMSRRARQRANARPWEAGELPEDDDDQQAGDRSDGCGEPPDVQEDDPWNS